MNTYQGGGTCQGKIIPINRPFASLFFRNFAYLICGYLKKRKDVTMRSLRDAIFYVETIVLQDFHVCISVPLIVFESYH